MGVVELRACPNGRQHTHTQHAPAPEHQPPTSLFIFLSFPPSFLWGWGEGASGAARARVSERFLGRARGCVLTCPGVTGRSRAAPSPFSVLFFFFGQGRARACATSRARVVGWLAGARRCGARQFRGDRPALADRGATLHSESELRELRKHVCKPYTLMRPSIARTDPTPNPG